MVFHRILDFKTRLGFYPASYFLQENKELEHQLCFFLAMRQFLKQASVVQLSKSFVKNQYPLYEPTILQRPGIYCRSVPS